MSTRQSVGCANEQPLISVFRMFGTIYISVSFFRMRQISQPKSGLIGALLNEEYWTHLEYVPKDENHLGSARTELQGALASSMLGKS